MRKPFTKLVAILLLVFASCLAAQSNHQDLDPAIFNAFLGTYRFSSGELIVVGRSVRRLYFYEPTSGLARGLERESPGSDLRWFAGPSFQVFEPVMFRIEFIRQDDEVAALVMSRLGMHPQIAKRAHSYREEDLAFQSADATLRGTLLLPLTRGQHPAVVCIHGSGEQDRNGSVSIMRFVADHFARHGVAVFIYDKRGVGASTGSWTEETLDDLASDGVAAFRVIQTHKEIDSKQVGLWGGSQASWIMPKIAAQAKDVAFIISVSGAGAGISVGDQVLYNLEIDFRNAGFTENDITEWKEAYRLLYRIVQDGPTASTKELDALVQRLQQNSKLTDDLRKNWFLARPNPKIDWQHRNQWFFLYDPNFDAGPLWQRYAGPVLGVFGELDGLNPVRDVVPIFARTLAARNNTDFSVVIFPRAHHVLLEMESDTPNDNDLPRLKKYARGYFDCMSDWLLRHVTVKSTNVQH